MAEKVLWQALRGAKLGTRFRRQHAIGPFIVDFFCVDSGLIVELDGPVHEGKEEEDADRERQLRNRGFRVLRFKNLQVFDAMPTVLATIQSQLHNASRNDSPSPDGRGGRGVR